MDQFVRYFQANYMEQAPTSARSPTRWTRNVSESQPGLCLSDLPAELGLLRICQALANELELAHANAVRSNAGMDVTAAKKRRDGGIATTGSGRTFDSLS